MHSALEAIYTNFFVLGWTDVVLAMSPPHERSPGWEQRFAEDIPTAEQFRAAFDQVRYRPVPN
jgi:hypothetical protein